MLRRLHADFGRQVGFVLVNTREAHPGERFDQPRTLEEKRAHADELRRHHRLPLLALLIAALALVIILAVG